ncbi:MAG: hypothetical protein IJF84_01790 [Thermoguttaceae bacterium]|nr:hypothetical protein [Thermoguttaceae bacterium]
MNFKKLIPSLVILDIALMLICYFGGLYCFFTGAYQYVLAFVRPLFYNLIITGVFACVVYYIKDAPFFRRTFVPDYITKATFWDAYFGGYYFHAKNEYAVGRKVEMYIYNFIATFLFFLYVSIYFSRLAKSATVPNADACLSASTLAFSLGCIIQPTLCFLGIIWRNSRTAGPADQSDASAETGASESSETNIFEELGIINPKALLLISVLLLLLCCFCISNVYIAIAAFTLIVIIALIGIKNRLSKKDWSLSVSLMYIDINLQWIVTFCLIQIGLQSLSLVDSHAAAGIGYIQFFIDIFLTVLMASCSYTLFKLAPPPMTLESLGIKPKRTDVLDCLNERSEAPLEPEIQPKRGFCGLFFLFLILVVISVIISILFLSFIESL